MGATFSHKLNRYRRGVASETEVYWLERNMCQRKIRHATEPKCETDMRAYRCPFCDGWHKTAR